MKKFETEVRLSREMTLMDVTLIGVGAMIGAGIFVLTGIAAGVAGPALILAFALNGFVTLFTAMAYAELGSCFHDAGGGYLWVKEGLPKWNGFLAGWMSWFAHAVACSLYALGFGAYFGHVLQELGISVPQWGFLSPQKILAAAVAVIFAYVNFRGASETGKVGNLVTVAKIVILAIFIGFGLELLFGRGDWKQAFTPFMPNGWGGVFSAMGLTFIAFEGYEIISQCSEEVRDPKRNIPRAVFLSILIVIPIYLLVVVTALGAVQPENTTPWDYLALHKELALVRVAETFFVGGGLMILVGGLVSTMSALNATIYSSSRVAFAMGRDRNFPTLFSRVHRKQFTPHWAILVSLAIILLMAFSLPIEDVASAADIMFLLLFLQVNAALIPLRKKRLDLDRGFVTPWLPWIPIVGIATQLALALYMFKYSPTAWVVTAGWIALGLVIYKQYASGREIEHARKVRALERLEERQYRILVCASKPGTMRSLTSVAMAVAKKFRGEIIFLHVIEVKEGQPLMAGLTETTRVQPLFEEAQSLVEESGISSRSLLKVSHRISQGIVETAREEECNFLIMGRQKHPSFLERFFSSVIDSVIQRSPCEVAVLHGDLLRDGVRQIFIPFGENIHTRLALEMAPTLVAYFQCRLRVAMVLDPDLSPAHKERMRAGVKALLEKNAVPAQLEVVEDTDVLRAVVQRSRDADLILMGGRSGDFLELFLGSSLTQEITERTASPVLWLREYQERGSFWASLLRAPRQEENQHGQRDEGSVD
ncbi:MAG: amino acid permease [Acidobacteria bacterium]|nr:amino acid permease [Acidobacteriota bacterium]